VYDDAPPTNVFIVIGQIVAIPFVLWMARRDHLGGWPLLIRLAFAVYDVVLIASVLGLALGYGLYRLIGSIVPTEPAVQPVG
jgi:hypothetical protein